jgi:peptidase S46-like protein
MKTSLARIGVVIAVVLAALFPGGALALEGKWTPDQLLDLDPKWLTEQGLEVPPTALWSRAGAGLLEAVIKVDGCSAGIISPEGLVITNHHCAFGILQQHSTPEEDRITHGFLAPSRAAELPGEGVRAIVPHKATDVTAQVEAAVPAGADDLARFRAVERKQKELVAACEAQPHRRCEVAAFDGGVRYLLIESLEYPDLRLVYAPPRAVGEYGGEVDNWSWPRHTGDFALLRVYAGPDGAPAPRSPANVPLKPRHFLPVSGKGVTPGSFVMLAGYPGTTFRSLTAAEMRERAEFNFPHQAELYRAWIDIMEAAAAKDEGARIALADRTKGLANREKNARGQLAGFTRGRLLEKKAVSEREVLAWADQRQGERAAVAAVAAHAELDRLVAERRATRERDFLLEHARVPAKPLELALTLVRWAGERAKPDLERDPDYQERNRERLADRIRLDQKRMHLPTEEVLLADLLARFAALPREAAVPAVDQLLGGARPADPADSAGHRAAPLVAASRLLAGTRVTDLAERTKMFNESEAELRARKDPLLDFAFALDRELLLAKERNDRQRGAVYRLRPAWQRAVIAHAGRPLAPDANGTLRVSLGHVQGYNPRDGVRMEPQTTLAGVVEKHTGKDPFVAPAELLKEAPQAPQSRWADPRLKDVPVNFLADGDTTGGSSGSPILNGKGELVGVNFDRVWEAIANDFGYDPEVTRNIAVDVRYLFWTLEGLHGQAAAGILKEMGVAP